MKKFIALFMSLALIAGMNLNIFAAAQTAPEMKANLKIVSVAGAGPESNVSVAAGGSFLVQFSVTSAESYESGTAVATVSGSGFTVDGSGASREFSVESGNTVMGIPIRCEASTKTGRYPVTLNVAYSAGGKSVNLTQTLNINVMGASEPVETEPGENYISLNVTSAPNGAVSAGETFDLGFNVQLLNTGVFGYSGFLGVTNCVATVSGEGFSLAGALAEQNVGFGNNYVTVLADKSLSDGRHQLTLTVTYKYGSESVTATKAINVDIVSDTETIDESKDVASFKLAAASIPEGKGRSNLSTKLTMTFENTASYPAENVKVVLASLGDLILNTYTDTVDVGSVSAGQKISATFPVKFPEFPKSQVTLVAKVTFETADGEKEQSFNVYLQATEKKEETANPETATLTPKVIISKYDVDVEQVTSGEEFTLNFTLENTSEEKDLRNMTVNVTPQSNYNSGTGTSSGPVFSFIDGTSSFYEDLLEKSGTLEFSIRLKCSASAGAGSYPIKISYNYEYANAGGYSSGTGDMDINLPVVQPIKLDLLEWTPPTECPLEGTMITFQYYNKSRNPLTSLAISMEGDFTMATQNVGTLNASSADYFSGMITPVEGAQVGDVKTAILVFTFEDAAGEEKRKEETFEVTITESMVSDIGGIEGGDMSWSDPGLGGMGGMGGMEFDENGMPITGDSVEEQSGLPLWAKIAIPSAAAVIVLIVVIVVVKVVKKKKAAEDEDEE